MKIKEIRVLRLKDKVLKSIVPVTYSRNIMLTEEVTPGLIKSIADDGYFKIEVKKDEYYVVRLTDMGIAFVHYGGYKKEIDSFRNDIISYIILFFTVAGFIVQFLL